MDSTGPDETLHPISVLQFSKFSLLTTALSSFHYPDSRHFQLRTEEVTCL